MKIAVPTTDGKLCTHFGHCETFSFVEVDDENKKILSIEILAPEGGVSCQSAGWVATQGIDMLLAGGMGQRPLSIFLEQDVQVVLGCPELEVQEVVKQYLEGVLESGENSCGHGENHVCGSHEGHHCGGHGETHHHCHGH